MKLEEWKQSRLVYSTGPSAQPPPKPVDEPRTGTTAGQKVLVKLDRKGRRGKTVTVVEGLSIDATGLEALAKKLKSACGSGGTIKDGKIEVQGEHRERILEILTGLGYRPKAAGG